MRLSYTPAIEQQLITIYNPVGAVYGECADGMRGDYRGSESEKRWTAEHGAFWATYDKTRRAQEMQP